MENIFVNPHVLCDWGAWRWSGTARTVASASPMVKWLCFGFITGGWFGGLTPGQ